MNRYNQDVRLVTPATAPGRNAYVITPAQAAQLMQTSSDSAMPPSQTASVIGGVFTPQPIGRDAYSPLQRAIGLGVRTLPFAIVYIILAIGIAYRFALDDAWLYLLFGIPMLLTVLYMSERTDRHTPAGVELERIAAAERTELAKSEQQERIIAAHLANQQELRRMSLAATIRMLERGDGHEKQ